jgi:DNA invertase Pin-like site-specific DNA recombinase
MNAQDDVIKACADRLGVELVRIFATEDAGVSSVSPLEDRPELFEAISCLEKGDILIVAKRDRLGRDPIIVAMIEAAVRRKGARIISAAGEGTESDSPTDVLMRRIVDAFGEYERLIIKVRTISALKAKKIRGERTGSVPFGKKLAENGKTLLDNPGEMEIARIARRLRREGLSLKEIADRLNEDGISTKNKGVVRKDGRVIVGRWHKMSVQRILKANIL